MKALSKAATKVMDTLADAAKAAGGHVKIENTDGTYMTVHVELTGPAPSPHQDLGHLVSVAHYYEQNADLMRDPEMEFLRTPEGQYFPVSFWQDGTFPRRDEAVQWSPRFGYRRKLQADLAKFGNLWMRNIKNQQLRN